MSYLVTRLTGEAFNLVSSVKDGCGFEGWRLLLLRYEPRTPATKHAMLMSIFNSKAAKKVDDLERNLLKIEHFSKYEIMSANSAATKGLGDDIKTVILMELCTPDLKEHLEFSAKELDYKGTRAAIMAYVERKRRDPVTAMEVGSHEDSNNESGWYTDAVSEES